ncbi:MAG: response regulator [Oscillospiraceae bacterium]
MALYKLLLVDDEEAARQAIAQKLDWEALGFQVVGEASNGAEALELCELLAPDVIMTDIQMPFMDGLSLCRRAKALLPGIKTAIFSGFDAFEYAQEAIKLEVEEYILKPIDAAELKAVFRRIKQNLDEEIARSRDIERLRRHYEESLPLMRQQLLSELLEGRIPEDKIATRLQEYALHIPAGPYLVAVLRLDAADETEARPYYQQSLKELVAASLPGQVPYVMFQSLERLLLLFALPEGTDPRQAAALLNPLFPAVRQRLGVPLAAGLGAPQAQLSHIRRSYAEALDALEYQRFLGAAQCVYIGDIHPLLAKGEGLDMRYAEDIVRQVKIGRKEDLDAVFEALAAHVHHASPTRTQLHVFLLALTTGLVRLVKDYQLEDKAAQLQGPFLEAANTAAADDALHRLHENSEALRRLISNQRKDSTRRLVETAQAYIEAHYADSDLSVDTLCGVLNVSPAYFSTIFKRETGHNFVGTLTRLRMQRAAEHLATSDDKTSVIAGQVGYADPNYFSYVFKKHYGVSPSKYRADRMENG